MHRAHPAPGAGLTGPQRLHARIMALRAAEDFLLNRSLNDISGRPGLIHATMNHAGNSCYKFGYGHHQNT